MPLPPPYDQLPPSLQATLERSAALQAKNGWAGQTAEGYAKWLDNPAAGETTTFLSVVKAVYDRCVAADPHLWPLVKEIAGQPWTYNMGEQVSMGVVVTWTDPDAVRRVMRASQKFCEDWMNVHGKADCFRELVTQGCGLHVCVMQSPYEAGDPDGNHHNIHIDQYQMVCLRRDGGKCNYQHTDSLEHYKQAVPWVTKKAAGKVADGAKKAGQAVSDFFTKAALNSP